jgi:hypothetical protein
VALKVSHQIKESDFENEDMDGALVISLLRNTGILDYDNYLTK